jgi:hypothetical protein
MQITLLCDQAVVVNSTDLEWLYVNDSKVIQLLPGSQMWTSFSISDYGYDSLSYKFYEVEVNARAAGDLNSGSEYILMFFNFIQIGIPWRSGEVDTILRQVDSYPIQKAVHETSFTMSVYASANVNYGSVKFTLVKFRAIRK